MGLSLKRIAGAAAASAALFASAGAVASSAAADDGRENRVLVVMLDFQDRAHAGPAAVKADFATRYFGAENSLRSYFDHVSRGRIDYVPAVPEEVIGPFKLPMDGVGCDAGGIRLKTLELLQSKGLNQGEDYDSLSMALPRLGCSWAGLGTIGGPVTWIQASKGTANPPVVVHEFGHNLGYPHQPGLVCRDGDLTDCEDGAGGRSPMGAFTAKLGLTATQLIHSGWLTASEHQRVTDSGTFTLRPLYEEQDGLRALEVPFGQDKLVLEYRRPEGGLDEALDGVYAYRVTGDAYRGGRPLRVGANGGDGAVTRLTDTAHKLTISVTTTDAAGARVEISMNGAAVPASASPATPVEPASPGPDADTPLTHGDHEPPADGDGTTAQDGTNPGTPSAAADGGAHPADAEDAGTHLAATGGNATATVLTMAGASLLLLLGVFMLRGGYSKRSRR
ncbi:hypothetical protein [Streptomyces sp. C10-9-1]|uniref:hypothetical protein n=1 Tax=Streptomyces sp. C10-9-1 TaxID=1859285 RepID=UPI003F4A7ADF